VISSPACTKRFGEGREFGVFHFETPNSELRSFLVPLLEEKFLDLTACGFRKFLKDQSLVLRLKKTPFSDPITDVHPLPSISGFVYSNLVEPSSMLME
jgi:hypothetical protein